MHWPINLCRGSDSQVTLIVMNYRGGEEGDATLNVF